LEKEKASKSEQLDLIKNELSMFTKDLDIVKQELEDVRTTTISLIQKEQRLNSLSSQIKDLYNKAGLKINI